MLEEITRVDVPLAHGRSVRRSQVLTVVMGRSSRSGLRG